MHKNNIVLLLLQISSLIYGAASSSMDASDQRYKVETAFTIKDEMVDISLAHLPVATRGFVRAIKLGMLPSEVALFVGPPGMGKTTSAKAIAQKYYNEEDRHVYHGASLSGDQYQNSGIVVLRQNLAPVIQRAKRLPQMVIIDEFQRLFEIGEHATPENKKSESEMLNLFDDMDQTENVVFVGTCNEITDLSAAIMSRFHRRFVFDRAPKEMYSAVLQFHLNRTGISTTVRTPAQLEEIISKCPFELRSIKGIVRIAKTIVAERLTSDDAPWVITAEDLLKAIALYKKENTPPQLSWEQWAKKHERKLSIAGTVGGLALGAAALWVGYKCFVRQETFRAEDIARQDRFRFEDLAFRAEDRARDTGWKWFDLMRQAKIRQEDIVRQDTFRSADHARDISWKMFDLMRQTMIRKEDISRHDKERMEDIARNLRWRWNDIARQDSMYKDGKKIQWSHLGTQAAMQIVGSLVIQGGYLRATLLGGCMKKYPRFSRIFIVLLILSLNVHHVMGVIGAWIPLATQILKYAYQVAPGLTAAMLADNIANMNSGRMTPVMLPEVTVEILKNTHDVSHIIEQHRTVITPTIPVAQCALEQCKVQQQVISKCTQQAIPKAIAFRARPGTPGIAYVPKTIGPEAYGATRARFIAAYGQVPKVSDHIGVTGTVDGATVISKPGTSPVSLGVHVKTSNSRTFSDYCNEVARLKDARAFVYQHADLEGAHLPQVQQVTSTIKPLLRNVEHKLIEIINNPPRTMAQIVDAITELQVIENNCLEQMKQVEILYRQGYVQGIAAPGLYSLFEETYRTVHAMRGAFCNGSGNITCLNLLTQQERLGAILGSHCGRIGYKSEVVAQRLGLIAKTNDRVMFAAKRGRMYGHALSTTEFNQDLMSVIESMRAGCPEEACVIVEQYNPKKFWPWQNWWHKRAENYCILQKAHQEALATLYNSEGMLKIYEQHPLWPEMQNALQKDPVLKQQIIDKLRNEHAFCMREFERIGIVAPTESQMQQMYTLVQYADVHNFNQHIQNIRTSADVPKALESCIQGRATETYLRELGFSDFTVTHIIGQCTDLQTVMCDPHFKAIVQDVGTGAHSLTERLQLLAERRDAISALMKRLSINQPNALTKALCYQLLDNYHDASGMLDILQGLDPLHADPLVRQAYADFFDASGLQKVLPVNDQVRALIQERLGAAIDIASDPILRDACNRLAVIQVSSPEELCIVERGLNYIELGHAQGDFMREYAHRYAEALTNPSSQNVPVLAAADAVDVFSQPHAGALGNAGLERLAKILDSSVTATQDNAQLLNDLKSAAEHIKNNDLHKAQRIFDGLPLADHKRIYGSVMPESASSGCVTYAAPSGAMIDVPIAASQSPLAKFARVTTAAQRLLQDGKVLLTTTDGVLVAINEDTIAHIAFDGSVDMLHSANGMIEGFAQNMQGFAEHAEPGIMTRRFILEHAGQQGFDIGCYNPGNYGAPVASSSSDHGAVDAIANIREGDAASLYAQALHARIGREQVASDVLTRVRGRSEGIKRVTEAFLPIRRSLSEPILRRVAAGIDTHATTSSDYDWMDFAKNKGFAKHVSKAAVYAVAAGGAPSPDDPRNRWNRFDTQHGEKNKRLEHEVTPTLKKECINIIEQMGFSRIKELSHGNAIFRKGRIFVSFDADNHNGGVWKMADSVKNLKSRTSRMGTYDKLLRRVGD